MAGKKKTKPGKNNGQPKEELEEEPEVPSRTEVNKLVEEMSDLQAAISEVGEEIETSGIVEGGLASKRAGLVKKLELCKARCA